MFVKASVALLVVAAFAGCTVIATESGGTTAALASADNGVLALTVNVKGAEVFIDGALFGQIQKAAKAQDFVVKGGEHTLTLKKFGFEDATLKIGVEAGGKNTLEVNLERTPAAPLDVTGETLAEKAEAAKQEK